MRMQLKRPRPPSRLSLMAASCALLGSTASQSQAAADNEQTWQVDSALLYYKENAGRLQVIEPIVNLRKDFGDQRVLDGTFVMDTLSGASPNGAIPSRQPQTFASPSSTSLTPVAGAKTRLYTIAPGNLPQDPNFKEQRAAGDLGWSQPIGIDSHLSFGGHFSAEHDFNSVGVNAAVNHDFNNKNTTLSAGFNEEYDQIRARGGNPLPATDYMLYEKEGAQTKNVAGVVLGVTQVMSRNWLAQFSYSYDRSQGYLTDPYRILSVVDGSGSVTGYRYESRPDSRVRQSLYLGNRVALGPTVLDLSYRRGKDDWGTNSNTVDTHLRIDVGRDMYLEPHLRWYRQNAADFYHLYVNQADPLPAFMSADPRLAAFTGTTIGVKFGIKVTHSGELSLRLEDYQQKATVRSSSLTQLQGLDLNPGITTTIVQIGWRQEF
jgi:Protein of unknown function (DUF3570)